MAEQVLRVKFQPGTTMEQRFKVVVEYLRQLIEDGLRDRYVRQKAIEIIHQAGVKQHDELGEIRAITKWVQNSFLALDTKAFRKYVKEISPDMDLKFNFTSELTGEEEALDIPFGAGFFYPTE